VVEVAARARTRAFSSGAADGPTVALTTVDAMETILRRHMWIIDAAAAATCALLLAHASSTALAARLAGAARRPERAPPPPGLAAGAWRGDPTDVAGAAGVVPGQPLFRSRRSPGGPPLAEAQGALPLDLLAIMYAPPPAHARWSLAIVRDRQARIAGPFAVGAELRGATVVEIEETRVRLVLPDGRHQVLRLLERVQVAEVLAPAAAPPSGITRIGEHAYELQRSAVEAMLGDMAALGSGLRVVPALRDGQPAGLRLFGIRPGGPLTRIGLESGDLLTAVNGLPLTSPDAALGAYTALRTAAHVSLSIERGGRPITLDYVLR
jgi:general secretion pathway protein C